MDKATYEKTVQKQLRTGKTHVVCSVCGIEISSGIEQHHIFGRNNADDTTPLCLNCHAVVTQEQNKVSPKLRSSSASPQQKRGFLLVSVGSLLELIGKTLKNLGHEVIHHE